MGELINIHYIHIENTVRPVITLRAVISRVKAMCGVQLVSMDEDVLNGRTEDKEVNA